MSSSAWSGSQERRMKTVLNLPPELAKVSSSYLLSSMPTAPTYNYAANFKHRLHDHRKTAQSQLRRFFLFASISRNYFFNDSTLRLGLSGFSAKRLAWASRSLIAAVLMSSTRLEVFQVSLAPFDAFAKNSRPERSSRA